MRMHTHQSCCHQASATSAFSSSHQLTNNVEIKSGTTTFRLNRRNNGRNICVRLCVCVDVCVCVCVRYVVEIWINQSKVEKSEPAICFSYLVHRVCVCVSVRLYAGYNRNGQFDLWPKEKFHDHANIFDGRHIFMRCSLCALTFVVVLFVDCCCVQAPRTMLWPAPLFGKRVI